MDLKQFKEMIACGCDAVIVAEEELTAIDAKFGDADHGITMTKVMKNIKNFIAESGDDSTFKALLDDISMSLMSISGGSAVPLWSTLFEGMGEGAPEKDAVNQAEFKEIFRQGCETLSELSKAKVGDKTMMDSLIPAVDAIQNADGNIKDIMKAGADAAVAGAKASEGFASKFGRAKSYKEQTIGTPDAGAVSMKCFFEGMSLSVNN